LSVIADAADVAGLSDIIFEETSTFGVRLRNFTRKKLKRRIETVKTSYGNARVKIGEAGGLILRVVPEYEDCARIAEDTGVPINDVYDEVKKAGSIQYGI